MQPKYDVEMRLDIKIPMRDSIALSTDIYLPRAEGPFPTVLIRTPYSNNINTVIENGRRFANNGYACVIQDCRRRWDSDGEFYPFREAADGYDTQEWIGDQDWSSGNEYGVDDELRTAHQAIYHNKTHPSHMVLPVIPKIEG